MPDTVQDLIRRAAAKYEIDEKLALAVAEQESEFNPTKFGPEIEVNGQKTRAIGTFQILPTTGAMLKIDPLDPRQNIDGGVKYLRQLLDRHNGDLDQVLRSYGGVKTDKGAYYPPEVLARVEKFRNLAPLAEMDPTAPGTAAAAVGGASVAPATAAPGNPIAAAAKKAGTIGPGRSATADLALTGWNKTKDLASSYDPRTPSGRVNLGATVGSVAATTAIAASAPASIPGGVALGLGLRAAPWLLRVLGPAAGAALGGGTAEAGNQLAATGKVDPASVAKTGAVQAAYDIGGQLFAWPLRKAGTYVMSTHVAKNALEGLNQGIQKAGATGRRLVHDVRQATRGDLFTAKQEVADAARVGKAAAKTRVDVTKGAGLAATREAKRLAGERMAALDLETAGRITAAEDALKQIPNPGVTEAGSRARSLLLGRPGNLPHAGETIGASTRGLQLAGEKVAETAKTGPNVSMAGVREDIAAFRATYPPESLIAQAGGDATPMATATPEMVAQIQQQFPQVSPQQATWIANRQILEQAVEAKTAPSKTLPGIVGLLESAPDDLPFAEAHAVKRMLDSVVNWDRSAKPLLEQATKGIRGTLRTSMQGHAPYDAATAAYEAQVGLYTRGAGKQLINYVGKNATPDKAVNLLDPKNPTAALQLRTLLVDQAAAGGNETAGREAWDALRAAWTQRKIIQGPIESLGSRLKNVAEMDPDFTRIVFGDTAGVQTLNNLDQIATAYTSAVEGRKAALKHAGLLGTAGEQEANDVLDAALRAIRGMNDAELAKIDKLGAQRMFDAGTLAADQRFASRETALQGRLDATARLRKFASSTLGKAKDAQFSDNELADVGRAVLLFGSKWSLLATLRLLKGPKAADVIEYAAYSGPNAQRMVKLITTPIWDQADGIFLRSLAQQSLDAPARIAPMRPLPSHAPTAAPPGPESRP